MKNISLILLAVLINTAVYAQVPDFPIQQQFDPEVKELVEKAKLQMSQEDYEGANATFRQALATKKVLPTDMSYFFAKTLFIIHQNQNALNFVDKYIQLAGQGGDYYDEAINLKNLINRSFEEIKNCSYCNLSGYRYVSCDNCNALGYTTDICYNCRGNSPIMCKKCIGRGVIITTTAFGEHIYDSCDKCNSKGYVECPVCHGEEVLSGRCNVCLGSGKKVSKSICNHQAEE